MYKNKDYEDLRRSWENEIRPALGDFPSYRPAFLEIVDRYINWHEASVGAIDEHLREHDLGMSLIVDPYANLRAARGEHEKHLLELKGLRAEVTGEGGGS